MAFMEICKDGNRPLQSKQFEQMCRSLLYSEADVERMRHERQKRRGSRLSFGLTRQLSWSKTSHSPSS
jgi:hypothetical protein